MNLQSTRRRDARYRVYHYVTGELLLEAIHQYRVSVFLKVDDIFVNLMTAQSAVVGNKLVRLETLDGMECNIGGYWTDLESTKHPHISIHSEVNVRRTL